MVGRFRTLPQAFYRRSAELVARDLLGRYLVRDLDGSRLVLRIVETEAYLGAEDRASHAWGGRRTRRTSALFRDGGSAYVYLIYGMYHCLNAVTGDEADGSAVLIRAGEAVEGDSLMKTHRSLTREPRPRDLAGGPGKLCQALAIDRGLNGTPLFKGPLRVTTGQEIADPAVAIGPRVGIDYAGEAAAWPLRFWELENREVSRAALAGR
jgi:DNA-3-methyladenine glycosylase